MDDDLRKMLEDMHDETKSLHNRHDTHDQQFVQISTKLDRIRRMLVAAITFDGKEFMNAWHDK